MKPVLPTPGEVSDTKNRTMTDPTGGGYGALDWLGIEDRCLAACVSKEWHEASQSAALWEHWTFHVNHLLDRGMQRDELAEPVHGQRANVLALLDLPRLSPMLRARLQRHATCVVLKLHHMAIHYSFGLRGSSVARAWQSFSSLEMPRLERVEISFGLFGRDPQTCDYGDDTVPPHLLFAAFPLRRYFAPLHAAKTVVVDRFEISSHHGQGRLQ